MEISLAWIQRSFSSTLDRLYRFYIGDNIVKLFIEGTLVGLERVKISSDNFTCLFRARFYINILHGMSVFFASQKDWIINNLYLTRKNIQPYSILKCQIRFIYSQNVTTPISIVIHVKLIRSLPIYLP